MAVFLGCFFLPVGEPRFDMAVTEAMELVKWHAREHVVLCLIPAFFIAGAIGVFVSQEFVMKYLGPNANKLVAYGVASVSGTILAVCRHAHRGSNFAGVDGQWYGQRPRACPAAGGSGAFVPKHAGAKPDHGPEKDGCVLLPGGCDGHDYGDDLRTFLHLNNQHKGKLI